MDWADSLCYTGYEPEYGKHHYWIRGETLIVQEPCALGQFTDYGKGTPRPRRSRVHFSISPPGWRILCGPPKVRFTWSCETLATDIQSSNVAAYSMNADPPLPYRLKSSSLRFQIPEIGLSKLLPDTRFIRAMRNSQTWQMFKSILFSIRTWARATIWGDRVSKIHSPVT